jgi:hypothetical protein
MRSMTAAKQDWLDKIYQAVDETERNPLLIDARDRGLTGISGLKTVGLLQRLAAAANGGDGCYLEIGVFQGLTLVSSALAAPDLDCFGVDNFRILDPEGVNKSIVEQRLREFAVGNATLINMDFEDALADFDNQASGRKASVYFVDGPHDYRSQLVCLLAAKPLLAANAVIVVDDANYPAVRQATCDFLASHPEYALLFEAYTEAHPTNLSSEALAKANDGWLNGVHVIVRDPECRVERTMPPVSQDRTLYFNDWLVHRLALAEVAAESLALAHKAVADEDFSAELATLKSAFAPLRDVAANRFPDRNTYSEGLTAGQLAKLVSG